MTKITQNDEVLKNIVCMALWLLGGASTALLKNVLKDILPDGYLQGRSSENSLRGLLENMAGEREVVFRENTYFWNCSESGKYEICQKFDSSGYFQEVLLHIQQQQPARVDMVGTREGHRPLVRELMLKFFQNSTDGLVFLQERLIASGKLTLAQWNDLELEALQQAGLAGEHCPEDFLPEMLEMIAPPVLENLFANRRNSREWTGRIFDLWCRKKLFLNAANGSLTMLFVGHLLWQGDLEKLKILKADAVGLAGSLARLALAMLEGAWQEAEHTFAVVEKNWQNYAPNEDCSWELPFLLARGFCRCRLDERLSNVLQLLEKKEALQQAFVELDTVVNGRGIRQSDPFQPGQKCSPLEVLVYSQLVFHTALELWRADSLERMRNEFFLWQEHGYYYGAKLLAAALVHGNGALPEITAFLEKVPYHVLYSPIRPEEWWRPALEELGRAIGLDQYRNGEKGVLGYALEFSGGEDGLCVLKSVRPRLLKIRSDGTYSRGRAVSAGKLLGGAYNAELTEEDRKICQAIKVQHFSDHDKVQIDPVLAAPALVGHPHLTGPGGEHLRLERWECCLEIRRTAGGGLELTMPMGEAAASGKPLFTRDAPGLYCLLQFTPEQRQLSAVFRKYGQGGVLRIPPEGEAAFHTLVPSLANFVVVAGNLESDGVENLRQIAGQVQLLMQLRPGRNGEVTFELWNRPASDLELMVRPGIGARCRLTGEDGAKAAINRDLDGEKAAMEDLLKSCPSLEMWQSGSCRWEVTSLESSLEILGELHDWSGKLQLYWPEGGALKISRPLNWEDIHLKPGLSADNWLAVTGDVEVNPDLVVDLAAVLQKLDNAVGNFVLMDEKHYLRLTGQMKKQLSILASACRQKNGSLLIPDAALPTVLEVIPEQFRGVFAGSWKEQIDRFERAMALEVELPGVFQGQLREYQLEGFRWLMRLAEWGAGACLADDMGLGKTIEILALLLARGGNGPSLVVAPASVCNNWYKEAERFAPTLEVVLPGQESKRLSVLENLRSFRVVVVSYGLLVTEQEAFSTIDWNIVVLDEAQAIKNRSSKRAQAAKKLRARCRVAATGTPVENHLDELWSLFDFLNPDLLGSQREFAGELAANGEATPALRKLIRPFVLRRLKSQVLDELPSRTEVTLEITRSAQEQAFYEALRHNALITLENLRKNPEGTTSLGILSELMRLRRCCCHPALIDPAYRGGAAKLEALLELVEELKAAGNRALIFSQFVDALSLIRKELDFRNISCCYLDGSTPLAQRQKQIDQFQAGNGDFFLISLKAGGFGLNLTAANYVVLYDPWWNPAVENQAADRVYRIGQTRAVTVYRLMTAKSVEEKVLELHRRKRSLAEDLLSSSGVPQLSREEMLRLFDDGVEE